MTCELPAIEQLTIFAEKRPEFAETIDKLQRIVDGKEVDQPFLANVLMAVIWKLQGVQMEGSAE